MVDLTNPSPLVMTHFEFIGFISGLIGIAAVLVVDLLRKRGIEISDIWRRRDRPS